MFSLKIFGLVLIYILRPNFDLGIKRGRVPLFFLLIILLAGVNFLFFIRDFSSSYIIAFLVGNAFWIFSLLSFHQLKLSVERYGAKTAHNTLKVFTILHFVLSIYQLVNIMILTGKVNPYEGLPFPYGMSTGDNIYGALFGFSLYNVTISTFLTIYFLFKRQAGYAILASTSVVLVFSNFGSLVYAGILLGLAFVGMLNLITDRKYNLLNRLSPPGNFGLYIPFCLLFIVIMYVTVSPSNAEYIVMKVKAKIFSIDVQGKNNYRSIIADQQVDPKAYEPYADDGYLDEKFERYADESKAYFSNVSNQSSGTAEDRISIKREMTKVYIHNLQGKTLAVLETKAFLKSSPMNMLMGAGTTRFSSNIAQKMAGFDSSRLFMNYLPSFSSPLYEENHKLLIEERIKSEEAYFSTANFPDSFYNQIFGEYGVLGVLTFLFFYVGYFYKSFNKLSYGIWLFLILVPFAHLSYIFDTLCVMPFFEWLMLIDIEE